MKLINLLKEIEHIRFNKWVVPSTKDLKLEFKVEHEFKNLDVFESEESFLEAVKNAKHFTVTKSIDNTIDYRSQTQSKEELMNLIKRYKSYPEFRNEDTVDAIYNGFKENKSMNMPIILKYENNMRVFSGNTRMDIAFQLGINPVCLLVQTDFLW